MRATLGWALFREGRQEEGIAELKRAVALMPGEDMWLAQLGEAYALAGRPADARDVLRRLEDSSRPVPVSSYYLAYVHTGLGDHERAIDMLERAVAEAATGDGLVRVRGHHDDGEVRSSEPQTLKRHSPGRIRKHHVEKDCGGAFSVDGHERLGGRRRPPGLIAQLPGHRRENILDVLVVFHHQDDGRHALSDSELRASARGGQALAAPRLGAWPGA